MRNERALVVVDLQNDYFPGGAMELVGAEAAAQNAARLLERFRSRKEMVVHVQHLAPQPGATFFRPGTPGADIHPLVQPHPGEPVIVKHFPSGFRETPLASLLRENGVEKLVICGAMTHMCIDTTVRAAFDLGFECLVVEDACATRDLAHRGRSVPAADVQASFMAALGQRFAGILDTEEFLSLP